MVFRGVLCHPHDLGSGLILHGSSLRARLLAKISLWVLGFPSFVAFL